MKRAVEMVADKHNYNKELIMEYDNDVNFLCLCGKTPEHIATITKRGKLKLKCSLEQPLIVTENHTVWFTDEQLSKWKKQLYQNQGIAISI